jgi:hypothetical protein
MNNMFPAFYKSIRSNLVVLATGPTSGIVVIGDNNYQLGFQSLTWVDFNDNWDWVKIDGVKYKLVEG